MDQFSTFITRDDQTIEVKLTYCPGSEPSMDSPGSDALVDIVEVHAAHTDALVELTEGEIASLGRNASQLYAEHRYGHDAYDDPPPRYLNR